MTKGGEGYRLGIFRAGHMIQAQRNTYKRVYKSDGSYHHPRVDAGLLRKKGELYFKAAEVTGSQEMSKDGIRKFSLKSLFENHIFPLLEDKCKELEDKLNEEKGGNHKVIVRYQEDGAGPHTAKELITFMEASFEKRGWMMVRQPPNSPVTNVMDYWIFPALSKRVSSNQAVKKGNEMLSGTELWREVQRAFNLLPLDNIAKAFLAHHQVVNAIAHCRGGDDYAKTSQQSGLHFGLGTRCRTQYDKNFEPVGVALTYDGAADASNGLKYEKPDVSSIDMQLLTHLELKALKQAFDKEMIPYGIFRNVFDSISKENVENISKENVENLAHM